MRVGHDPAHLAGVDTVVVLLGHPRRQRRARRGPRRGLRVLHRSQALAALMERPARASRWPGANGKTTTTSMLDVGR